MVEKRTLGRDGEYLICDIKTIFFLLRGLGIHYIPNYELYSEEKNTKG